LDIRRFLSQNSSYSRGNKIYRQLDFLYALKGLIVVKARTISPFSVSMVVPLISVGTLFVAFLILSLISFPTVNTIHIVALALAVVSLMALLLLATWRKVLTTSTFTWSIRNIGWGLLGAGVLALLSVSVFSSSGPHWYTYYPFSPLSLLASGEGIHQDTAFHVSLIHSILNVGYPSTGQHHLPFIPYHVLSHYVDASLFAISGLEPLDAFGLLFLFKVWAFLAASTFFVWLVFRRFPVWGYSLGLLVLVPTLAGDWIYIGSEGLWFTTILLIVLSPVVANILRYDIFTWPHAVSLLAIGVLIGLGKVSSGLGFALLVGGILLIRHYKDLKVYVLGLGWITFFVLFAVAQNSGEGRGIKTPHLSGFFGFLNPWTTYPGGPVEGNLIGIYLLQLILLISWLYSRIPRLLSLLVSSIGTLFVIAVVVMLPAPGGLSQPDIAYFVIGLYYPLTLLTILFVIPVLAEVAKKITRPRLIVPLGMLVSVVLLAVVLPKPSFQEISTIPSVSTDSSDISEIRNELTALMDAEGMSPQSTRLFVTTEDFSTLSQLWGGEPWAIGLTLYSVTGIPLVHGITDPSFSGFGQKNYPSQAHSSSSISPEGDCINGISIIQIRVTETYSFDVLCSS
jgi:hypothetical protein